MIEFAIIMVAVALLCMSELGRTILVALFLLTCALVAIGFVLILLAAL